jgi:hypothetical protein
LIALYGDLADMIVDVPCTDVSEDYQTCFGCGKELTTVSFFERKHTNCLTQMARQLSKTERVKAYVQKRNIAQDVKTKLRDRLKQAPEGRDIKLSPKRPLQDAYTASASKVPRLDDPGGQCYMSGPYHIASFW